MIKYTKPPIKRLQVIHHRLKEGNYPNTVSLSEELEASRRTVLRDIEYLRDQMGAPVEYDSVKKGFFYTNKSYSFPSVQITEGELIAIFLAEKALSQCHGTPYEESLRNAFQRIVSSLPDEVTVNLSGIEQTYSFRMTSKTIQDIEIFKKIADASINKKQIKIDYYTAYRDTSNTRIIDPYQMVNLNGDWYLFAFCHSRNEIRTFLISRIEDVEATGNSFEKDASFDIKEQLGFSFGIYTGKEKYTVKLKFDELAARYIREKIWHHSQTIFEKPDGSIVLTLRLNSIVEIRWWILSWGEHVEVLSPAVLRRSLAETASFCARRYKAKK